MSLNNIQLSSVILHELFENSLVQSANSIESRRDVSSSSFGILGNNRRNICVIVESEELYIDDGELNFLLGVLSACRLTMDDVAILNLKNNPGATYKTITLELMPENFFLFGALPSQIALPLDFPNYQIQRYNGQTYVSAPTLLKLQRDKIEKAKLWNCLKEIFSI